jgi:hypothetical protein
LNSGVFTLVNHFKVVLDSRVRCRWTIAEVRLISTPDFVWEAIFATQKAVKIGVV